MASRSRSIPWLVAAVLTMAPARSRGQDTPLYRDPSPADGPRIEGPLLPSFPSRPSPVPPPPSTLGPFQPSNPGLDAPSPEVPPDPLLIIPPMPPPLQAFAMPPFRPIDDVQVKRKTTIRPPHGPLSQCHERLRLALFGPRKASGHRHGLFHFLHGDTPEGEAPTRLFEWPTWPTWPLSNGD